MLRPVGDSIEGAALSTNGVKLPELARPLLAVLDRIDEIVPPGTTFSSADSGWVPPSIDESALRRR
jgi:hypothetical protein